MTNSGSNRKIRHDYLIQQQQIHWRKQHGGWNEITAGYKVFDDFVATAVCLGPSAARGQGVFLGLGLYDRTAGTPTFGWYSPQIGNLQTVGSANGEFSYLFMDTHPSGTLYGADGDRLYTVNPMTGDGTLVATFKEGTTPIECSGLTFAPDGMMYIHEYSNRTGAWCHKLFTGNASTGQLTYVADIHGERFTGGLYGIEYANGVLYACYHQRFYSIDPVTGLATRLAEPVNVGAWDLDFGPDGVMYASIPKDGCYGVWWGIFTVTLPHALFTPLAEFTSSQNKETWGIASQSSNPPPVIDPEPAYTQGLSNTVSWSAVLGADEYYLEWDTTDAFSNPVGNSGWTANTTFTATGLADAQIYYYRVKGRNTVGESGWSIAVFSTQDNAAPTGTIVIDGGAEFARTVAVTLTLSATDAVSGVTQMHLSNDNVNWSEWESYTASRSWTIPAGDGTKTVYVQYKDAVGNTSDTVSDTITLDEMPPVLRAVVPDRGSNVGLVSTVTVNFSEAVTGVVAGDLTVNGTMATAVTGSGTGPYTFTGFTTPAEGPVSMSMSPGTIQDAAGNAFAGETWSCTSHPYLAICGRVKGYDIAFGSSGCIFGMRVQADNGGGSVVADSLDGTYELHVPFGWSETVSACKPCWYSVPLGRNLTNVTSPQGNVDFTLVPSLFRGDANGDNEVNFSDYLVVSQNFGGTGKEWNEGDFTADGVVNFSDYLHLSQNYETTGIHVSGTVELQNFGGDKTTIPVTIKFSASNGYRLVNLDQSGHYSLVANLAGNYDVTAQASHWLRKKQTSVSINGDTVINFSLINGDVNGDNVINATDVGIVNDPANMGKSWPNDPPANPNADLDGDGDVDPNDAAILDAVQSQMPLLGD